MRRQGRKPRGVTLALGGGGARALSDLGVLQTLEEAEIPIDGIAGTSMGALIGALYARLGSADKATAVMRTIDWRPLSYLLNFKLPMTSLYNGDRIRKLFELLFENAYFADCPIPLTIVATDLGSGETVMIREGALAPAVQASSAIPNTFPPVRYGMRTLVDGGLTEPIPVPTARLMADESRSRCVVAVDSTLDPRRAHAFSSAIPKRFSWSRPPEGEPDIPQPAEAVNRWLKAQDSRRRKTGGSAHARTSLLHTLLGHRGTDRPSMIEVAVQTSIIRRHTLAEAVLVNADVVARSRADEIGVLDFARAGQAVEAGRRAATEVLPEIHEFLAGKKKRKRKIRGLLW